MECSPPISLTLHETLSDPPCRVGLRLRWRLEPVESGSLVVLDARYHLNGPAYLNRRHWKKRINAHCGKLLAALEGGLADTVQTVAQGEAGVSGHSTGSINMTVTNTTTVRGSPSLK